MQRGDSWERRGQNPATTTIKMWNQCSNLLATEDEGCTVSIKNAKVDVYKDFVTLTSTTGITIERVLVHQLRTKIGTILIFLGIGHEKS